ncbi:glutathione peroxidase [Rhizobacter sp. P5_C2]
MTHFRPLLALASALLAGALLAPATASAAPSCPALLNRQALRLQDEKPQNLCQYAGQVVVIVNTASFCGFTPQYKGLEALYQRYRDRGLVVLGFPSNDFGSQEPGSSKDIADFCENTFGVKFPMFTKTRVAESAGAQVDPLYVELRRRTGAAPKWNFHKYVVSRDGNAVQSFASTVEPDDAAFVREIERQLAAK